MLFECIHTGSFDNGLIQVVPVADDSFREKVQSDIPVGAMPV